MSNSNVAAETEGKGASPERTDDNDSETGSNYEEVVRLIESECGFNKLKKRRHEYFLFVFAAS